MIRANQDPRFQYLGQGVQIQPRAAEPVQENHPSRGGGLDEQSSHNSNKDVASDSRYHGSRASRGGRFGRSTGIGLPGGGGRRGDASRSTDIGGSGCEGISCGTTGLTVGAGDGGIGLRGRVSRGVAVGWRRVAVGGEGDLAHGVVDDGAVVHGVDEVSCLTGLVDGQHCTG